MNSRHPRRTGRIFGNYLLPCWRSFAEWNFLVTRVRVHAFSRRGVYSCVNPSSHPSKPGLVYVISYFPAKLPRRPKMGFNPDSLLVGFPLERSLLPTEKVIFPIDHRVTTIRREQHMARNATDVTSNRVIPFHLRRKTISTYIYVSLFTSISFFALDRYSTIHAVYI